MPEKEYIERETVRTTIKNLCTKYNQAFGGQSGGGLVKNWQKLSTICLLPTLRLFVTGVGLHKKVGHQMIIITPVLFAMRIFI